MKLSNFMAMLLVSLLPLAFGCKTREQAEVDDPNDTAAKTSGQEVPGVDQPGDLNPVEAQTMVDDVTIGRKARGDGTIAAEDQADDFTPGEMVYLSANVADTPAGSALKVVWYGPGGKKVGEEQQTVATGNRYLTFQADTSTWEKGDYRAEVWIGDEKVDTQQLQLVDATEAGR